MNYNKAQLFFLAFIVSLGLSGQDADLKNFDYSKADSIALNQKRNYKSSEKLAKALTKDLHFLQDLSVVVKKA